VHGNRELQARIDELAEAITNLKADIAVAHHYCPDCLAPPGKSCFTGRRYALAHSLRIKLLEWD
jgi:hypothetical protein